MLKEDKMCKDYLKKLLKYMKEVYYLQNAIKHLKDRKTKQKYYFKKDEINTRYYKRYT